MLTIESHHVPSSNTISHPRATSGVILNHIQYVHEFNEGFVDCRKDDHPNNLDNILYSFQLFFNTYFIHVLSTYTIVSIMV